MLVPHVYSLLRAVTISMEKAAWWLWEIQKDKTAEWRRGAATSVGEVALCVALRPDVTLIHVVVIL